MRFLTLRTTRFALLFAALLVVGAFAFAGKKGKDNANTSTDTTASDTRTPPSSGCRTATRTSPDPAS